MGGAIASLKLLQVLWKQYNRRREPAEEETTDSQNGSVGFLLCEALHTQEILVPENIKEIKT